MYCSNKPGLGIIPNYDVLGNPVMHLFDRSSIFNLILIYFKTKMKKEE